MAYNDPNYARGVGHDASGNVWQEEGSENIGAQKMGPGKVRDGNVIGGYSSTITRGPDGELVNDPSRSGYGDMMGRYRGLGEAAAQRGAYQAQYGTADQDRAIADLARGDQMQAAGMLRDAAMGGAPSQATGLGQGMLDQSLQGQMAAQAGARAGRPGGLASIAAQQQMMAGQQGAQNAGQVAGLRAGEIAQARGGYGQGAYGIRAGDLGQQGMSQQRQMTQLEAELEQRRMNQNQAHGYDALEVATRKAQHDAHWKAMDQEAGMYDASFALDQKKQDAADAQLGAGASAVGGGLATVGGMFGNSGGSKRSGGIIRDNPYGDD
jgi:hypothetical protein